MGPILAGTFGAVIKDKDLRDLGVKTEIVGLFLCVVFGFLFGLLGGCFNTLSGNQNWPTSEMISRGQDRSLWIGALIALPSGVGVALSVLGGNAGSLVGVAISASLLPPAVNAGLLWGLSAIRSIRSQDEQRKFVEVNGTYRWMKPSLAPNKGYEYSYFDEMDKEYALLGLISLLLTLVNIICIFISAVAVLKIKEVAPRTSVAKTARFWKQDIKIARVFNSTLPPTSPEDLGNQFIAEWATLNGLEPDEVMSDDEEAAMTRIETLRDIIEDVEADEVFQTVTQSVVNKKDTRPLSRRLSVLPAAAPHATTSNGTSKPTQRNSTVAKNWVFSQIEAKQPAATTAEGSVLHGVQLRRPQQGDGGPPTNRDSVAILRQSLSNAGSPYSLWPAANPRPSWDGRARYRHTMEPLSESSVVQVPMPRQRASRFLHIPEIVVRETTC